MILDPRDNSVAVFKPVEFLSNQYATFRDIGEIESIGVDHLGVRLNSNDCPWYVQNHELDLCYKYPFLRPSLSRPIELWDVPRPPNGRYTFYAANNKDKPNPLQIRCINLSDLVGLTFFCSGRAIYAIHAHKNSRSFALDTYSRLTPTVQKYALLRYFPLNTDQETINEVWVRESQPFPERTRILMMRTSQRTEVFGPEGGHRRSNYAQLMCGPPTALLYHVPACGETISVFGVASHSLASRKNPESPVIPYRGNMSLMHHSQASLEDVAHVELYIHPLEYARCSGMLVTHDDGREEALGQRRIGLPDIEIVSMSRPGRLHYRRFQTPNGHWRLKVIFSTDNNPRTVDANDGWFSQSMMGIVTWSFDWRNDQIAILNTKY
ncbi:hypothetical protein F5884DRAFT_385966 [Xylogone sp. PMI_703]|nr:hypothetical protein F5884DRAFT_385966 [Xylogone sp. PMI_703]